MYMVEKRERPVKKTVSVLRATELYEMAQKDTNIKNRRKGRKVHEV